LFVLAAVLAFSLIKVLPSYQEIFADFDVELPRSTSLILGGLDAIMRLIGIPLGMAAILLVAGAVFVAIAYLCDWAVLQPLLDWIGFSRHRAHLMRLLAASLARDLPLTEALERLQAGWAAYPSRLARRRIAVASESIAAGQPWTQSLEEARLISASDAATLRAAQETGHLPWTLRMLADRKLQLFVFRWATIQHILFTLAILLIGALVFFFITAMFIPLVKLIESLVP
jgi:type II secretory pathway component PulF